MEPTGIKVLDDLLGGGLPRPSAVGIIGAVGSGKSSLVRQLAVTMLERDFRVLYYAIDESAEDVRESVATYGIDRKSTRLNSSHITISYAVFCLKKKKK